MFFGVVVAVWEQRRASFLKWAALHKSFRLTRSLPYPSLEHQPKQGTKKAAELPVTLLVTSRPPAPCETPEGDYALYRALKNKMDYARLHGMQMVSLDAPVRPELDSWWQKVAAMPLLMAGHPDVEWFFWMDADAVFTGEHRATKCGKVRHCLCQLPCYSDSVMPIFLVH